LQTLVVLSSHALVLQSQLGQKCGKMLQGGEADEH
jgi:hypothetical protein